MGGRAGYGVGEVFEKSCGEDVDGVVTEAGLSRARMHAATSSGVVVSSNGRLCPERHACTEGMESRIR